MFLSPKTVLPQKLENVLAGYQRMLGGFSISTGPSSALTGMSSDQMGQHGGMDQPSDLFPSLINHVNTQRRVTGKSG